MIILINKFNGRKEKKRFFYCIPKVYDVFFVKTPNLGGTQMGPFESLDSNRVS